MPVSIDTTYTPEQVAAVEAFEEVVSVETDNPETLVVNVVMEKGAARKVAGHLAKVFQGKPVRWTD
jgi:hypothetical protein